MQPSKWGRLFVLLLVTVPGWAELARCSEGVIEINMAGMRVGGVTPSDAAGFPITLDAPGSYQLTGNLDLRGETLPQNVTAIRVEADDVTLDLNGFEIIGNVSCPTGPTSCTPSLGIGIGVWAPAGAGNNLTVQNGTIRGMGSRAVQINTGVATRIVHMQILGNGENGIDLRDFGVVRASHIASNANVGANLGQASLVTGNTVEGNGSVGVRGLANLVVGNHIAGNLGFAISQISPYVGNVLADNNGSDPEVENSFDMGNNVCNGLLACP